MACDLLLLRLSWCSAIARFVPPSKRRLRASSSVATTIEVRPVGEIRLRISLTKKQKAKSQASCGSFLRTVPGCATVCDWLMIRSIGRVTFQEEETVVDLICFASKHICRRTKCAFADVTKASSQGKDNTFWRRGIHTTPCSCKIATDCCCFAQGHQSTFLAIL